jgi:imidazolonepropionase-like amidohydrolase
MRKLVTALLLFCAYAMADGPVTVAIRNAKIVPVSGPVINKGTVVMHKGLITDVGDNVQVPADAWVIEGEGLTVYPGLIDALSTVGMPGAAAAAATTGGRGAGRGQTTTPITTTPATPAATPAAATARSMGPEDRPQTTSWTVAADEISATDRRIETVRGGGITTAVTFPTRGIFGGQGSVIDLMAAEKAGEMVVASPVGQYIALGAGRGFGGGGGGGFPSSLMGIIAYIRQVYLDADHYKLVKEAYAKDPRGMERPEYDRALEGVLASPRILLPANRLVEVDRMLRFAAELKQPTIIYGGREAYRDGAADLFKKYNTPLLISLKWPTLPASADPDSEPTMRTLEDIDKAPSAPAVLKKAGVRFALYSDGIDTPRDLQRAVKKAIDAGLSREDALRAMTLSPAEIYGIDNRVGSIEKGKIGNLVVTKGEIFDNATQVVMIFVDGKQYKPEVAPAGGRGMATDEPGGNQ